MEKRFLGKAVLLVLLGLFVSGCHPILHDDAGAGGEGGWGGEGGTSDPICEPGAIEACYSGPEGTEGVGICRAGERVCIDGFSFSPCLGEQTPEATICTPDDCDSACLTPVCGNGILEPGEDCDDGHVTCTSACRRVGVRQIELGFGHSCALLWDGEVKCWGGNAAGELGIGDTRHRGASPSDMGANLPAVDLGTGRTARAISGKGGPTCALLDDGSVKCWGLNVGLFLGLGGSKHRGDEPGQMGDDLPALDLGPGRTAKAVSASASHACVILDDDTLRCWSSYWNGPVSYGVDLGVGRTAKTVVVGDEHACAILDDDSLKCWGANYAGQLGLGDTTGRGPDMVDSLPPIDLGTGRTAKGVALGIDFTCAILDDDSLKCWGSNHRGQLGRGTLDFAIGGKSGEMGDHLPAVDLGSGRTAKAVTASWGHTCAVLDDDSLKCWGRNDHAELGLGDRDPRGNYPGQMGDHLPAVDLGTGKGAKVVASHFTRTCAILDDYRVKCWGQNSIVGQLGLGDTQDRGGQPGEMGDALPYVELH